MTNFKNKNGQILKTAYEKVAYFGKWPQKLSSYYNSRTTNYHSIYNSELFIITTDKAAIVAAGFHPLTKAIIRLNMNNEIVKEVLKAEEERKAAKAISDSIEMAKKEAFKQSILNEAASIKIDEQFKTDLATATVKTGKAKSDSCAAAFKALLSRNSIAEIKSDFWQVFRILKSKA